MLSVRASNEPKAYHYPIFVTNDGQVYMNRRRPFATVAQMVQHYVDSKEAINDRTHATCKTWELHREHVELGPELGHGEYGTVHRGTLLQGQDKTPVAIKLLKVALDKTKIQEFSREARLLRDYKHPNIVQFFGVSFDQEPIELCMELADGGSLDKFLKKSSPKTNVATKLQFCVDAARGLSYLHAKNCVHRDVSARNCLVSNGRIKISDFGLAYQLTHAAAANRNQPTNVEKMPVRWLAPEAMSGNYSLQSDVYSFGVLMWEIFSNAQTPFDGKPLLQVFNEVQHHNLRLERPDTMPDDVGRVMTGGCFGADVKSRWPMDQIRAELEKLLTSLSTKTTQPTSTRSAKQPKSARSNDGAIPKCKSDKSSSLKRTKSARHA